MCVVVIAGTIEELQAKGNTHLYLREAIAEDKDGLATTQGPRPSRQGTLGLGFMSSYVPVSYTHLTLPTKA